VLTEYSAADWGAGAQYATATVTDDTSRVHAGSASVHFNTDGGFDTWAWAPVGYNGDWDLLAAGAVGPSFWVYAVNNNSGFQGPSPWIRLYTNAGGYIEYSPDHDLLNDARNQWVEIRVPLNGDDTWSRTIMGDPDLSHVNYIEIHGDTWEAGFDLWFDDLAFDVPLAPPGALRAIAGNGRVQLSWEPFNDILGQFDHYAVYRETAPFDDVTSLTPIDTLSGLGTTSYLDDTAVNGTHYYYAVTAVLASGAETSDVFAVGPRTPRNETDLQIASLARTPHYPRYLPNYTYYEVTEPSGFGPYAFTAATSLGGGQNGSTQRWSDVGDPVTYTASIRNRGTNIVSGMLSGTWRVDGDVVASPSQSVSLDPEDVVTFTYVLNWDDELHDVTFAMDVDDARPENNTLTINTKSAGFLTYVDVGFAEDFRELSTPEYPQAVTDDMIDWLQRHAARMNEMFVEMGSLKRVHYDVLEMIDDRAADPTIDRTPFAIFPFRYYSGSPSSDPRIPSYYHADEDIDYGLCHEMSHQLGMIDLYRLDLPAERNYVSGETYWATDGLMRTCAPFYSQHSANAMNHWLNTAHGYYGQYLYSLPEYVDLRIVGTDGEPVVGANVRMYQKCERPGQGEVITTQIKAQGVTGEDGIWRLPNVPIDSGMVPTTYAGDQLRDNPFGYVAVVGTNGLLLFQIEYLDVVSYAWLEITEVNNAYWAGDTDVVTIEREIPVAGGVQHFPPEDLTELNAVNWTGWAQYVPTGLDLYDDTYVKQVGAASLKVVSTGYSDNGLRYPAGIIADWDLSHVETIHFWARASATGFQNYSPWLRLGNLDDGYYQYTPTSNPLTAAIGQWVEFEVPIAGDATWTRTVGGNPSLSSISYIELHADPQGTGFTLWLDGLCFYPQPGYAVGDLNCDGIVNNFDISPFILALTNEAGYVDAYPDCDRDLADVNDDGIVNNFDIAPFIDLLLGK
jgi:hypothetical protein